MAETNRSIHDIQSHAVGTLSAMSLETTKPKEGSDKPPKQYLKAEITAAGSRLKITVFGSQKRPNLPAELNAQLAVGQKVAARGSLQEEVGQDLRLYRGMRAWIIAPAEAHEEEKLVYHISGYLQRLEKTAAGDLVAPINSVYKQQDGTERENILRVCPSEALLKMLYERVRQGQVVRSRGDILNKMNFDRFGLLVPDAPMVSQLTAALIEVWNEQQEIWVPLQSINAAPAGPATAPTQPQQLNQPTPPNPNPNFHDDDDVPF